MIYMKDVNESAVNSTFDWKTHYLTISSGVGRHISLVTGLPLVRWLHWGAAINLSLPTPFSHAFT